MSPKRKALIVIVAALLAFALLPGASAQKKLTVEQFISAAYPFDLVAAKKADRIAWVAYERGMRNAYTAAAPDFKPVKLTNVTEDDGNDISGTRISDDGSIVLFVRGHTPNREGWIANPTSDPHGAERAVWAVKTTGVSKPWKVVVTTSNPVLSPNGQWVLFTKDGQIHRAAVNQSRTLSDVDKGEKPFFKVFGNNSNPRWSPDGTKIAFVSNRGDHSFITIYDVEKQKISYVSPSVDFDGSPTWSADGRRIAFTRRPGTPFGQQTQANGNGPGGGRNGGQGNFPGGGRNGGQGAPPQAQPPGQQQGPPPPGQAQAAPPQGQTGQRGQGQGQRGQGQRGQGQPAEGDQQQQPQIKGLTRATFKDGYNLSFMVADLATGEAKEFWHNAPNERVFNGINNIQWAGDNIIFQLEPEEWVRYYSVPVSGSGNTAPIVLTPGDGMVENVGLSSDGKNLFYCTNAGDIDRRHIWKVPTAGGQATQISTGADIETYPAVLASGEKVAVLFAGAKQPQSVAMLSASGGKAQIIFPTLPKDFPVDEQVAPENVTLKAEDGLEFHNQLFLPKDLKPGERRPALIFVHGGPQRQMLLGYHYLHFYHLFYAVNEYLASQGYIVMSVNYRSGIGYGKSFRNAPRTGQRGNSEYQDVLAAGKYLQGRADVDPKRVGIWGLSYGGLLTAQALARNSDIFAAGVDMAGVHLWGTAEDPKSVSYQSSPIAAIEKWKSPVLLIQGDDDRNVQFSQIVGLVQMLRAHGVHHELIVLPDDVHETLLHQRWVTCFHALDEFFTRNLKNASGETKGGSSSIQ